MALPHTLGQAGASLRTGQPTGRPPLLPLRHTDRVPLLQLRRAVWNHWLENRQGLRPSRNAGVIGQRPKSYWEKQEEA